MICIRADRTTEKTCAKISNLELTQLPAPRGGNGFIIQFPYREYIELKKTSLISSLDRPSFSVSHMKGIYMYRVHVINENIKLYLKKIDFS